MKNERKFKEFNHGTTEILSESTLSNTHSSHVLKSTKQNHQDSIISLPKKKMEREISSPCTTTNTPYCAGRDQQDARNIIDEDDLTAKVAELVNELSYNSQLFDIKIENRIPRFDDSEIKFGSVLGRGGFCVVNEISKAEIKDQGKSTSAFRQLVTSHSAKKNIFTRSFSGGDSFSPESLFSANNTINNCIDSDKLRPQTLAISTEITCESLGWGEEDIQEQVHDRNFISKHCKCNSDGRYALKRLDAFIGCNEKKYITGLVDLAMEARFLAVVDHPHIVKMRAMSLNDPFKMGYFIVLDRLYGTLPETLCHWKKKKVYNNCLFNKLSCRTKKKNRDLWMERLNVAYDLSSAMKYLHDHNILLRDLKPDNIGFDARGDVKLFDLGLAVELRDDDQNADGCYDLKGRTGSLRYMSPEVALNLPYNLTADVYSFGVLLWQICALETPFFGYTPNMHQKFVVKRGYRPIISSTWSPGLAALLKSSWCECMQVRQNFKAISDILLKEIKLLKEDGAKKLAHNTDKAM